ncbi:restriction endonuclease subunit S [Corynebacterium sanguinis]|uniref:restriction endonuclease subunit S n=1 Tax=Corynebacterium sanguinis TaxID=2594913 RepID=UPI0021B05253|nr:restriction endonuclease subunit S [Corynebacterium sanguinis]MCT1627718.1 restriction endonuclease subunit S [Corynebacterium sanguinis]
MSEWREVAVEALCSRVTSGGTPSRKRADYYTDEGIPWVKSQELIGARIATTEEHISEAGLERSSAKLLPPDTVLLAMYGANVGQLGWLGVEATVNQAICAMVTDPKEADARFLYYALAGARERLVGNAHGAAQQNLSQQLIKPFKLAVPALATQQRIGAILRSIDELIENNRRRIEVLEKMARAIYREWFVKFRYPGHEGVPMVDSALGLIPEGWQVGELNDLVQLIRDTVDPAVIDAETPAVGLEHIPRKQITLDSWGTAGDQGSRKGVFEKGDVLFGKIRPYFHKVSVAPIDGICSTDAIVLRPASEHWGQAVLVLSSGELVAHATATSNGTKMPRADWKVLGRWPVALPPSAIAGQFTEIARDQLEMAETLMFENARLTNLRDLLLPKLVTGKIDVTSLDLDAAVAEQVAE